MEQAVALALAGGRDRTDNSLDLPAGRAHRDRANYWHWIRLGLGFKLLDDPFWNLGQHAAVQNLEPNSRPPDDVTALATGIDVRMYPAGTASHPIIRLE